MVKDIEKLLVILRKLRVIPGRTRFQKIIFLLENKDRISLTYNFIPYYYGPYSSELQLEIDMLEASSLIQVVPEDGNLYVHCLTEEGRRIAAEVERKMTAPEIGALSAALRQYRRRSTSSLITEAKRLANMPV
jgi:uncharacterized protein YwgA